MPGCKKMAWGGIIFFSCYSVHFYWVWFFFLNKLDQQLIHHKPTSPSHSMFASSLPKQPKLQCKWDRRKKTKRWKKRRWKGGMAQLFNVLFKSLLSKQFGEWPPTLIKNVQGIPSAACVVVSLTLCSNVVFQCLISRLAIANWHSSLPMQPICTYLVGVVIPDLQVLKEMSEISAEGWPKEGWIFVQKLTRFAVS